MMNGDGEVSRALAAHKNVSAANYGFCSRSGEHYHSKPSAAHSSAERN